MPQGPKEWSPRSPKRLGPPVGLRVELVRDVDRYPDFQVAKGAQGTIVYADPDFIRVRMDETIEGADPWDNEVHWFEDSVEDFEKDVRILK